MVNLSSFRIQIQGVMDKVKHKMYMRKAEGEKVQEQIQKILADFKYSDDYKREQAQLKRNEWATKKEILQAEIIEAFQDAHEEGKRMYKKAGEYSQEDEIRLLRKQLAHRDLVEDLVHSYQNSPAKLGILAEKMTQAVQNQSDEAQAYVRAYKRLTSDSNNISVKNLVEWAENEVKKQSITDEQKEVMDIMNSVYRLNVEYQTDVVKQQIEDGTASTLERISLKNRLHELTHDLNVNGLAQSVYLEEEEDERNHI
ncbi:hypothetical protein [Bacillus cereus group sp. Bce001]|uniref:hypothetical protein n=1 Tax=Bacillus cereus group sp. Bce001 TaxID=3445260 RepID=UPI003F1FEC38